MNDFLPRANYLDLLTESVAELADQLRHSFEDGAPNSVVPPCAVRLGVLAELLTHAPLKNEQGSLARLGVAVGRLSAVLQDGHHRNLVSLEPSLEHLTEVLESTLVRLDAGDSVDLMEGDPVWLTVLSRLQSAGTALEIMDELDACAGKWEERWGHGRMSEDQMSQMRQRWLTFREYGDAMFASGQATSAVSSGRARVPSVVLLVESVLRRDQLLQKLRILKFNVQTTTTVEEAVSRARSPLPAEAIICDNLEPSNHLTHLARGKIGGIDRPALVLVTAGSGRSSAEMERARRLGADGIWAEPFNTQPLAGIRSRIEKN